MRVRRLNVAQRVVVVVGVGVALLFFGEWLTSLGAHPLTGWTGFAPLQNSAIPYEGGLHPWVRLVIWIIVIALWIVVAMALLRSTAGDPPDAPS